MTSVEQLTEEQALIGRRIEQIFINYKKDSASRKTVNYLLTRLSKLEKEWSQFEYNEGEIAALKEVHSNHPYFKQNYFQTVKACYEQIRGTMETALENLTANQPDVPQQEASSSKGIEGSNSEKQVQTKSTKSNSSFQTKGEVELDLNQQRRLRRQNALMSALERLLITTENELDIPRSKAYYTQRLTTFEKYWADISALHQDIMTEAHQADYNLDIYFEMENHYLEVVTLLQERLATFESSRPQTNTAQTAVKLPKITLPTFDGNYLKWEQFRDLFTELIHNQPMGSVQKMMYLKSNLVGEASKIVHHLPVADSNYSIAWNTLQERYENKRLIATAYLDKLISQPPLQSESAASIKALHDNTKEVLLRLENMGLATDTWSPIVHHLIIKKLDRATHNLYEQSLTNPKEIPSIDGLLKFLETRFQSLEAVGSHRTTKTSASPRIRVYNSKASLMASKGSPRGLFCPMCKKEHPLYFCQRFLALTPYERTRYVKQGKMCINCLKDGHSATKCPSRHCSKCPERHNTLLHQDVVKKPLVPQQALSQQKGQDFEQISEHSSNVKTPSPINLAAAATEEPKPSYVFLATAIVHVVDNYGNLVEGRAILDSGSQLNFITERFSRRLGFTPKKHKMNIVGIGESGLTTQGRINIEIHSRTCGYSARIEAFVLSKIASDQPSYYTPITNWAIPKNIQLADPNFNLSRNVDILIGAELYCSLLSVGQIKLNNSLPLLQNTLLGWVVTGKAITQTSGTAFCGIGNHTSGNLEAALEKFWEIEEIDKPEGGMTPAEQHCEELFKSTTVRDVSGRYIVRLPLKQDPSELGKSWDIALQRFLSLEKKLVRNVELKQQYTDFIHEYLKLNHMEEISHVDLNKPHYFLPHHCVIKPESSTTKLRVVFDASAKTTTNMSLNDIQYKGPKIQDDLVSILLRFRTHRYVFTSDITKMYRQIWIDEADRNLQLIIWRDNPQNELKLYRLRTVTYGTTSAPYLATRCLHQLAEDEGERFPLAATITRRDFYIDDVMTGSDSLDTTLAMQAQLIDLMKSGGFSLRKWCANHSELLKRIPKEDRENQIEIDSGPESFVKTLGITWYPKADTFVIKTSWKEVNRVTKRSVLADIAHLFDPLGFVNPVVVSAKIFMQELWALKLNWDAALPAELHTRWLSFREGLSKLNNIEIPRHMVGDSPVNIQIHAFSDASEKAYGSAVYLRSESTSGDITVRLICAKSRVAPKKIVTLPRLELCAAKLMAQLVDKIKKDMCIEIHGVTYWTDSQIVLSWLQAESSTFKTFVANRVSAIHKLTDVQQWKHINTKLNPADLVSRGITPDGLLTSTLWFNGPPFLSQAEAHFPQESFKPARILSEEKQAKTSLTACTEVTHFIQSIDHKNSFRYLQRVVAYIARFCKNLRTKKADRSSSLVLSVQELRDALHIIAKMMQKAAFKGELLELRRHKSVLRDSPLSSLAPFLDHNGIIRVGGRLQASSLPYEARHPIVLPHNHPFTKMLLTQLHVEHLHVGPQALLAITRQQFWPLRGKQLTQTVVHQCIKCFRAQPRDISQMMGNLPTERIQPARPFLNVGIDFLGPVQIHYKIRGKTPTKAYIAVFVCFATKATHFEVVSDLTTTAFIGALKRFIGRRGCPAKIFCDNATNFIGARNELNFLKDLFLSEKHQEEISEYCSHRGINWHPIPPRSPHIGGLWEAAVKMAKHHLKRVLGSASLTYEELSTVIIQVEAILNSRPLTPMSSNPNDMQVLTPGHFIIGEPLTTLIDPEAKPNNSTLLARWNLVKSIHHEFWRRWSAEYLQELQRRYKWKHPCKNIEPGTLVLLKDENLPPLSWKLGRIIKIHTGQDGHVRIVDIKTPTGETQRSIHRICPLPLEVEVATEEIKQSTNKGVSQTPARVTRASSKSSSHPLKGRFLPINSNWTKNSSNEVPPDESQSKRKTSEQRSKSKRLKSSSFTSMINVLLLAFFVLPTFGNTAEIPFEISTFDAHSGAYFEDLGSVDLVTNEWNLIVYFDTTNYWLESDELLRLVGRLQNVCRLVSLYKELCRTIIKDFEHELATIEHMNNLLRINNGHYTRSKRSPFDFIGTVANRLFGVLDQEYANHMENIIRETQANENHLLDLIRNQTSLIDSTQNIIKKDEEYINKQFSIINDHLIKIRSEAEAVEQQFKEQRILQFFNIVTAHTSLVLSSFRKMQTALIDAVTDTHHGKISPLLVTPEQLREELHKIRENLPPRTKLPLKKDHFDLQQLYKLITVGVTATNQSIIFNMKLPLIKDDFFNIYNIIPMPVLHFNSTMLIQPPHKYLIVDLHKETYYMMSENEFRLCKVFTLQHYLCQQRRPIYTKESGKERCEISLFLQQRNIPEDCTIKRDIHRFHWIPLHHLNQWIYCLKGESTITIVCNSMVYEPRLHGKGLLRLKAPCIMKHQSVIINSQSIAKTTIRTSFTPGINLKGYLVPNTPSQQFELQLLNLKNNSEVLTTLARQLAELKTEERLPQKLSNHDTHQFIVSYTVVGVIIIILSTWAYLRLRGCRQRRLPKPKPRKRNHQVPDPTFELREFKAGEDV